MILRKGMAAAVATATLLSGGIVSAITTAAPAQADTATESGTATALQQILSATNAQRAANGLPALALSPGLNAVAQKWSETMASEGKMYHNPDYSSQIPPNWLGAAENVAAGYDPAAVVAAWMESPGHRANILGNYTHIGIGYALGANGYPYYTQNFARYAPAIVKVSAPVFTLSGVNTSSFTASWTKPSVEGGSISSYKVILKRGDKVVKTVVVSATALSAKITGLRENTRYAVIVQARAVPPEGGAITSKNSSAQYITTALSAASTVKVAAPTNLTATAGKTSIKAAWTPPAVTGTLTGYTVTLKRGTTVVRTFSTTQPSAVLSYLRSNVSYTVSVKANAVSSNGIYKASSPYVAKTIRTLG